MRAFIRGFFATDGSLNTFLANKKTIYPRIEMCNVSKKLIMQINDFLVQSGFRTSTWVINKNKKTWNEGLRLTITGFEMLKKWQDEIGFVNPKQIRKASTLLKK